MDLIPFTHPCEVVKRFLREWDGLVELKCCDVVVSESHTDISLCNIKVNGMDTGLFIQTPYSNGVEQIINALVFILLGVFFASNPDCELANV